MPAKAVKGIITFKGPSLSMRNRSDNNLFKTLTEAVWNTSGSKAPYQGTRIDKRYEVIWEILRDSNGSGADAGVRQNYARRVLKLLRAELIQEYWYSPVYTPRKMTKAEAQ